MALLAATEPGKVALPLFRRARADQENPGREDHPGPSRPIVGGKGGGRAELAQGGGTQPDNLSAALARAEELVRAVTGGGAA